MLRRGFIGAIIALAAGRSAFTGRHEAIMWNPFNKVVQDHRDGSVDRRLTDRERARRGLPTPWTPELAEVEVRQSPVF